MRRTTIACCSLWGLLLAGCDTPGAVERVPDQPISTASRPTSGPASAAPAYADEDLPVPPDFEAEAEQQITADNYAAELTAIEQDLGVQTDAGTDGGSPPDAGSAAPASSTPDPGATRAAGRPGPPVAPPKPATGKGKPPAPAKPSPAGDDAYD